MHSCSFERSLQIHKHINSRFSLFTPIKSIGESSRQVYDGNDNVLAVIIQTEGAWFSLLFILAEPTRSVYTYAHKLYSWVASR